MKSIFAIILAITSAVFFSVAFADESFYTIPWGYTGETGPQSWGKLDPSFELCGIGKEQSPIDIKQSLPIHKNNLQINYQPAPINIIDDGLTQLNIHGQRTIFNDGHTIQINFAKDSVNETINFYGEQYHLVQLHFHTPSETLVDGKAFPVEIHFVNQSHAGNVAVIGVLIKEGQENPAIATLLQHLPQKPQQLYSFKDTLNPAALLPLIRYYYNFQGSLTTPPCTEGLQWLVMQKPIEASAQQIAELQKAIGEQNARPVQPLHNRKVFLYQ